MESDQILICRLCFKICDTNFTVIKDSVKEMLNFLSLKMNFDISTEPVICSNCMDNLRECFNFKVHCLHKGGDTSIKHEDRELNVANLCPRENVAIASGTFKCCSCMKLVNRETSVLLMNEEETVTMLEMYFPELVANGTMHPMCISCYKSLQNHLSFISNCLIIEEKINEYCKVEGTNSKGQVQLSDVLRFISKNQLQNSIHSSLVDVKMEESCEETKNENKTEIKKENFIEVEEPRIYCIKKEDIDIKMEQDNGDRPDAFQTTHKSSLVSSPELYLPTEKSTTKETMSNCRYGNKQETDLLSRNHLSEVTVVKCEICTFKTKHKRSLQRHVLLHKRTPKSTPGVVKCNSSDPSEEIRYKCEICTYQSKRKGDLLRHMLTHEDPSGIKMFNCEACTYQSKRKDDLLKHTLIHKPTSDVTLYKCEMCTYQSKRKRNLSAHMLTHKDPSQVVIHKCKICTYQSKRKYLFSLHILTHKHPSEVTMYKCDVCTHQTRRKGNLSKHMLTHKNPSEVIMYKCELCTYQSKRKDRLPMHMLMHKPQSEVTMHKCEMCSFQSRYKHYISKHMLIHKNAAESDTSENTNVKYVHINSNENMVVQDTC